MTRRKTSRADLFPTLKYEQNLWKGGFVHVAGIDEAGRGAWAGPVAAAAVILPCDLSINNKLDGVRDSKLMTPAAREGWAPRIRQAALACGNFSSAGIMVHAYLMYGFPTETAQETVDALASLIEPMIMVVLGVIVGGIVIAIYLPIFKLGQVV